MERLQRHAMRTVDSSANTLFPEPSLQKIFLAIYLSDEPVSLKEVSRMTGLSLASVSTKAKEMVHNGFLEKRTKPGSRELFLHTDQTLPEVVAAHTDQKLKVMRKQEQQLHQLMEEATPEEREKLDRMLEDVKKVIDAQERMRRELEADA
ncbi:hypothetical protein KY327_03085 [Candidatus Woesearchaeota archaeon]|nr:hypothetical protein [Candidatus Woesearchaeota archaeon]